MKDFRFLVTVWNTHSEEVKNQLVFVNTEDNERRAWELALEYIHEQADANDVLLDMKFLLGDNDLTN